MYIEKPEPIKVKTKYHVCAFHKANPGVPYPGCTCASVYEVAMASCCDSPGKVKCDQCRDIGIN